MTSYEPNSSIEIPAAVGDSSVEVPLTPPPEGVSSQTTESSTGPNSVPAAEEDRASRLLQELWKHGGILIPFIVLFFAKIFAMHYEGIFILLGLIATLVSADRVIVAFASKKPPYAWWDLVCVIGMGIFLCLTVVGLNLLFAEQKLYKNLYCGVPNFPQFDSWTLLWTVMLTDFSLKYISMLMKICVVLTPTSMLSRRGKGTFLMHVEQSFTFYRCLPPTTIWILFFTEGGHTPSWYSAVLVILYFLTKALYLWSEVRQLWRSFRDSLANREVGSLLNSTSHLDETLCSICHDELKEPLQLKCQHVFCSECIECWLNRESTCPLCRVEVAKITAKGRDGGTSYLCQLF